MYYIYRPLSASATAVCVIPPQGEYFIPKHLHTVWKRLQTSFYTTMKNNTNNYYHTIGVGAGASMITTSSLFDTNYETLTNQFREVWKEGKITKFDKAQEGEVISSSSSNCRVGNDSSSSS